MQPKFTSNRQLGRTGFQATALGIGDLADRSLPIETCVATAKRAIEAGLNVIDTAPMYEDGYSEEIVGRAVAGVRTRMFIIDKIDFFDRAVTPQIEASLSRLNLSHTDAFVFHNLSSLEVLDEMRKPGGGFDELRHCIERGYTRFGGISSHHPDVLRAALTAGLCDVVMFPVGPFVDSRYVDEIFPLAKRLGVATVGFKTFGAGKLVGDTVGYNQPLKARPRGKISSGGGASTAVLPRLSVAECLHYTMTLDPDVALLGLSFPNEQDEAFAAAEAFKPLGEAEMTGIRSRAREARKDKGPCWWNPDPEA